MKKLLMLPFAFISFLVFAGPIEDEIIARIHQPGAVCLQGEACASAQVMSVASTGSESPARGMCFDCSDDDIRAVVDYMTASVQ